MENLFAYGTLMCEDIMQKVSGLELFSLQAILSDFQKYLIKEEPYPALIPEKNIQTQGVIYYNISKSALDRLDRFEGKMYSRQIVYAETADYQKIPAYAYILKPEFMDNLTQKIWDYNYFLKSGKKEFQQNYTGFNYF